MPSEHSPEEDELTRLQRENRLLKEGVAQAERMHRLWQDTLDQLSQTRSQLKEQNQELAAREVEFRTLAEHAPINIARFDREGRFVYLNIRMADSFDASVSDLLGHRVAELPHFDRYEGFERLLQRTMETGEEIVIEAEVPGKNGPEYHLVHMVAECNEEGEVTGLLTMGQDISQRKKMEEDLRLAASVFDAAREGIVITDADGIIINTNPSFSRITGYSLEEVQGKKTSLLASGQQSREFYEQMWSMLIDEGYWDGELINRRKSGEIYNEHLSIAAIHDDRRRVVRYVGVFSDTTLIKQQEQQLEYSAHHDALTGLPNRLLLSDRIQQSLALARRNKEVVAVIYLDLDGFKPVNDRYGHEAGDFVLIEIARRMSKLLRVTDTVSRIGGDEFVLLLRLNKKSGCETTLRRLVDVIALPIQYSDHVLKVSASIGVSFFPDDGDTADNLLRQSDQAMYEAKNSGRNRWIFVQKMSSQS